MLLDALVFRRFGNEAGRVFIMVLGIAVGVGLATATSLTIGASERSFADTAEILDPGVQIQIFGIGNRLDESILAKVRYTNGVAVAQPVVEGTAFLQGSARDVPLEIRGVDVLQPVPGILRRHERWPSTYSAIGAPLNPVAAIGHDGVVLTSALARQHRLHVAQAITVVADGRPFSLQVAQVLPESTNQLDASVALVDVSAAQVMFRRRGFLDRIDCVVDEPIARVRAALIAKLPSNVRIAIAGSDIGPVGRLLQRLDARLWLLTAVAFVIGATLVYESVMTSVARQASRIAALRAIGASRAAIFRAFLTEGLVCGLAGAIAGAVIGIETAQSMLHALTASDPQPIGISYDGYTLVQAFQFGLIATVPASLAAAYQATRIAPAVALSDRGFDLRGKIYPLPLAVSALILLGATALMPRLALFRNGSALQYCSSLAIMGCGALLAPLAIHLMRRPMSALRRSNLIGLRLAAATVRAIPARVSITLAAFALAMSAAVGFQIAGASFGAALDAWAQTTFRGDLFVLPIAGRKGESRVLDSRIQAAAASTPGVLRVEGSRSLIVPYRGSAVTLVGDDALRQLTLGNAMHEDGATPAIATSALARRLDLAVGSRLQLPSNAGILRLRVVGVRDDFSDPAGSLNVDRRVLVRYYAAAKPDMLRLYVRPGAAGAVKERLLREFGSIEMLSNQDLRRRATASFGHVFVIVNAIAYACLTLAVAGLGLSVSAFAFERRGEIRILRAVGASKAVIQSMVAFEAGLWALIGAALGVLIALLLAADQLQVIDLAAFGAAIPLRISWMTTSLSIVAALAGALVASIPASRQACR